MIFENTHIPKDPREFFRIKKVKNFSIVSP